MKRPLSFWVFLISGAIILACIPLILISEKHGLPDYPYHFMQLVLIPICFAFGIGYFVKYKKEMGGFVKLIVRVGVLLCGLFILFVGYLLFGDTIEDYCHRERFDAEIWRDERNIEHDTLWPPRLCMVNNLMSSGKLDGLTKNQVTELLGPPHDNSFPFGSVDCDIHYYLGPERGFMRIDSEWLFITFCDDDKVERCWLYRD